MVPGKKVESFHVSLDKNPGGIKRQQAARELRAAADARGVASAQAAVGRAAARTG